MLKEGIINSSFSYEIFNGNGYFVFVISGDSESPDAVRDNVAAEVERIKSEGIAERDFRRFQKGIYAGIVREQNNVEAVANVMLGAYLDGVSPFDAMDMLAELTPEDVLGFVKNELNSDRFVLSVAERMSE